jgi:hypothetical protein
VLGVAKIPMTNVEVDGTDKWIPAVLMAKNYFYL